MHLFQIINQSVILFYPSTYFGILDHIFNSLFTVYTAHRSFLYYTAPTLPTLISTSFTVNSEIVTDSFLRWVVQGSAAQRPTNDTKHSLTHDKTLSTAFLSSTDWRVVLPHSTWIMNDGGRASHWRHAAVRPLFTRQCCRLEAILSTRPPACLRHSALALNNSSTCSILLLHLT